MKKTIKKYIAVNLLALIILFITVAIIKIEITGFTIEDQYYKEELNLLVDHNTEHTLELDTEITGLLVSGSVYGEGTAKIYLEKDGSRYLVFDSGKLSQKSPSITGYAISYDKKTEPSSKEINVKLEYKNESNFDADNDGIESQNGVIDLTVENTIFAFQPDEKKLCTAWETYSIDTSKATIVCYGNEECCSFIGLKPSSTKWDDIFYVNSGRRGATTNNMIGAKIAYVDYSLDIDNPYSDIYYSDWSTLEAGFYESEDFENICLQTCSLSGSGPYKLIFEVDNSMLKLDSVTYSMPEDSREYEAQVESAYIFGKDLYIIFRHHAETPKRIRIEGDVDYTLNSDIAKPGEKMQLIVHNWDYKYFEIKIY